jgi:predicted DNA binding protein
MSYIAEVVVGHRNLTLTPTLQALPEVELTVESQPVTSMESPVLFYLVDAPDFEAFEAALGEDYTVAHWRVTTILDDRRIYRIEYTPETRFMTPMLTEFGLRVLEATSTPEGWHLRVHTTTRRLIEEFIEECTRQGVECQLESVYTTSVESEAVLQEGTAFQLTDRQREVARTATQMGYFDSSGASAEEVAAELDIAASTLSSHLRAITEKLYTAHFG